MRRTSKRKSTEMVETKRKNVTGSPRERFKTVKLETSPPVNCLKDLIKIGKNIIFYKNLDIIMLWRITPYLEELDKMIGMETLKESIFYQIIYYLKNMHIRNRNEEYLHTMIMGPPGAGKTSVARILGKIYQVMGILSLDGPFNVAYRDDFIAGYLGQTAIKTRKLLESCIGGVLFVDEVYSFGPGDNEKDSFSKEAIETITAFLSEHKNDFCFIGAGYENEIKKCFFNANKGLERRFQWIHKIDKYSEEELTEIMIKMIDEMKWSTKVEKSDIVKILKNNTDLFKNAGGDIETFLSKCKMVHARRVFNLENEHKFIISKEDMEEAVKLVKKYRILKEVKDDRPPFGMYC